MSSPAPVCVEDFERAAALSLPDGSLGYYAGGAGDELTLRANREAWGRHALRPRMLVDVGQVDPSTTVLGSPVSFPAIVAPTALHRLATARGELATAEASAQAGTLMTLSTLATIGPAELAAAAPPAPRWFQLYLTREPSLNEALIGAAADSGYSAIVLTVDAPRPGLRERDLHTGFRVPQGVDMPAVSSALGRSEGVTVEEFFSIVDPTVTWERFAQMAASSPLPVVVKGILTAEDAALACEHGAAGVIVSNHGGRQLDGVQATAFALPEVVAAVDGRVEVLVDGGIRRGRDILVALALGARAVLVGRPVLWGLAVGGRAGALQVLERLRFEFETDLALLGCRTPADVQPSHACPAGPQAQA